MAIQTHMYPENLGLPISSQDCFFLGNNFIDNNNNNNNNNLLYNGRGLNQFNHNNLQHKLLQQQQQQQQQLQYQQQVHLQNMQRRNFCVNDSFVFLQPSKKQKLATTTAATTTSTTTIESDNYMSMNFSQSLSAQLQKQGQEIDRYVTLQNEWLKLALQEQRKQQLGAVIKKLEVKTLQLLKQKDDEIKEATKKSMELQEIVRKMEVENQAWQRVAAENEAMVFSLNNTLEKLKQQQQQQQQACSSSSSSNGVDDAESCCNVFDNKNSINKENKGVFSSEGRETTTTTTTLAFCKVCNTRNACVLLLPCRHLCSCKACDVVLDACPVCKSPKMASIHAIIS